MACWSTWALCNAQHPLINEVMPGGADMIEVYNPGRHPVDLKGYTFVVKGASHRIQEKTELPPHGCLALFCDHHSDPTSAHLHLRLPRTGGSVLLIAPDRSTVCDLFSWPSLPSGVSIGRVEDGGREWGYFEVPTPGSTNAAVVPAHHLLPSPVLHEDHGAITIDHPSGGVVRYTIDGSTPSPASPPLPSDLRLPAPAILSARAFAEDALPSAISVLTITPDATLPHVALRVDPAGLYDAGRGLLADGPAANFSRTGRSWRREAQFELTTSEGTSSRFARIAVSGSGTRSLAKKNFKLFLDADGSSSLPADELILRADATPNAFLRNLFMECIAGKGSHVDVQPSHTVPVYLNGRFQGAYRLMPAKNSAWLRSISGAESVDIVDGPGLRSLKGNGAKHERMMSALLRGAPLDTLASLIDVTGLIDLACFDLWTGRADPDLNARCWRPRESGGRWRWILFDMDLWAPPDEHTVQRLASGIAPEAPYLPQLLAHDDLRPLLLARLSAWMATTLAPDRASALADSLYLAHRDLMRADHERWKGELVSPEPEASIALLRSHIAQRPAHLFAQLAERTGQVPGRMTVAIEPRRAGEVFMEGLPLTTDERSFTAFAQTPLHFTAIPAPGYEFVEWQDVDVNTPEVAVLPGKAKRLRALFRPVGSSKK